MPWTDLNALLGLPPESPRPRMSALSMLPGDAANYPADDIGEVGPSQPRMGPDSEDNIGQAGPMPPQGWTGGGVQGMPASNVGQVGARPPQATPKSDMAEFGPLASTAKSARLPLPFDALPGMRQEAGTGGAAGQASADDVASAGAGAKPPTAASLRPKVDLRELDRKRAAATWLAENGTPAARVRAKLELYGIERQLKKIEEGEAEAQTAEGIELAPVDDISKQRGRALAKLGAKPDKIAEAMGLTDAGLKQGAEAKKERTEKLGAFQAAVGNDSRISSSLKIMAEDANKLLDTGWQPTTGTLGHVAGMVPGSQADKLRKTLGTIQAIVGFDRLQQMRDQSKTGGALGSIAVKELEFLQAVQGSLDITQDPATIKRNIGAIVRAQKIFAQMRTLVPGLEAGDPEATRAYGVLNGQLGTVDHDVQRIMETKPKITVPRPKNAGDEQLLQEAAKAIADGADRGQVEAHLTAWGVGAQ